MVCWILKEHIMSKLAKKSGVNNLWVLTKRATTWKDELKWDRPTSHQSHSTTALSIEPTVELPFWQRQRVGHQLRLTTHIPRLLSVLELELGHGLHDESERALALLSVSSLRHVHHYSPPRKVNYNWGAPDTLFAIILVLLVRRFSVFDQSVEIWSKTKRSTRKPYDWFLKLCAKWGYLWIRPLKKLLL